MRRLQNLPHDNRGATLVEFALIAPTLCMLVLGMFEMGYNFYVQAQLQGAVQKAARDSTIQSASGNSAGIDAKVRNAVHEIVPGADLEFSRRAYSSFSDVHQPEDFTDVDDNGVCNSGEPFEDANANGIWDQDRGIAGGGGARDAVLYVVTVSYHRAFGVARLIGLSDTVTTETTTVLRNQPWDAQKLTAEVGHCLVMRLVTQLRRLWHNRSGAALIEFALCAPVFMAAGLWGVETANQAIVQMRVNQIAMLIADNASRVGENSLLGQAKIYEGDIDDVLYGAHLQGGDRFGFYEHGRVILSSLEVYPDTPDRQYIHWQRCMGKLVHPSTYGEEGDGADGSLAGMGPTGEEIVAFDNEAVMFVEVAYVYQPIISTRFSAAGTLTATAAFNVRENRDLGRVYQRNDTNPDPVASCDKHEGIGDFYG